MIETKAIFKLTHSLSFDNRPTRACASASAAQALMEAFRDACAEVAPANDTDRYNGHISLLFSPVLTHRWTIINFALSSCSAISADDADADRPGETLLTQIIEIHTE